MKRLPALLLFFIVFFSLSIVSNAYAAAPDGMGPWADAVTSFSQGTMKNGNPVPAIRSNPLSTLGVAENNTASGNFLSLGFGGSISLLFQNGISSGVFVVEATNPGYPIETASVELSVDGTTWVFAGNINQDGVVNLPQDFGCAQYVRITDSSNPDDFSDDTADGYDVDGVRAEGESCNVEPPTGCTSIIVQTNNGDIVNNVTTNAQTGSNNASGNTDGSTTIISGNASANTTVTNIGNTNSANGGCCCDGDVAITIAGNGANSVNNVSVNGFAGKYSQAQTGFLRSSLHTMHRSRRASRRRR